MSGELQPAASAPEAIEQLSATLQPEAAANAQPPTGTGTAAEAAMSSSSVVSDAYASQPPQPPEAGPTPATAPLAQAPGDRHPVDASGEPPAPVAPGAPVPHAGDARAEAAPEPAPEQSRRRRRKPALSRDGTQNADSSAQPPAPLGKRTNANASDVSGGGTQASLVSNAHTALSGARLPSYSRVLLLFSDRSAYEFEYCVFARRAATRLASRRAAPE